jgi:hypothetical protein
LKSGLDNTSWSPDIQQAEYRILVKQGLIAGEIQVVGSIRGGNPQPDTFTLSPQGLLIFDNPNR